MPPRQTDNSEETAQLNMQSTVRRNFLVLMAAGATSVVGAPVSARQVRSKFPPDVGSKFYADGRVHPFPGNTVICHVPQQGEHSGCFNALLDIYRRLRHKIGRASCRERVCQYVSISVVAVSLKKQKRL